MDQRAARWHLSLPIGVIYRDGSLVDTVTGRLVPLNDTGAAILQHLPLNGIDFQTLTAALATEFDEDQSEVANDVADFMIQLNERHLMNIRLPFGSSWLFLWRTLVSKLLQRPGAWFPNRRWDLGRGGFSYLRLLGAFPTLYGIMVTVGMAILVTMVTAFTSQRLLPVLLLFPMLIFAFFLHEGGHMLAIRLLNNGGCFLVSNPLRMSTVHRPESSRREIVIGLAGPTTAVCIGVVLAIALKMVGLSSWGLITLPLQLQIVCFLPGFGDADRLWLQIVTTLKHVTRR